MKIVKVMSMKVGDKQYSKYIVNLPKGVVENSKLLDRKLKARIEKEKIIIEKE